MTLLSGPATTTENILHQRLKNRNKSILKANHNSNLNAQSNRSSPAKTVRKIHGKWEECEKLYLRKIQSYTNFLCYGVAVDSDTPNENAYIVGSFRDTVDFDWNGGTEDSHIAADTAGGDPTNGHFITRIDATGDYGWTRSFNDSTSTGGVFTGTTDFNRDNGFDSTDEYDVIAGGWRSMFFWKYNQ